MTPRRWALFIVINILVSAMTALLVMNLWESSRAVPRAVVPTTVPTLNAVAQTQVAATVTALPPKHRPRPTSRKYTVESGDTFSEIARKFDVSVDDICGDQQSARTSTFSRKDRYCIIPGSPLTPTPTLRADSHLHAFAAAGITGERHGVHGVG